MSACTVCQWPHNVVNGKCEQCATFGTTREPPYVAAAFRRAVRALLGLPEGAADQEAVDALMGTVAEAGLWRAFQRTRQTDDEPACAHERMSVVMQRCEGRTPVVFWCRDCGALGSPGDWRLPGERP